MYVMVRAMVCKFATLGALFRSYNLIMCLFACICWKIHNVYHDICEKNLGPLFISNLYIQYDLNNGPNFLSIREWLSILLKICVPLMYVHKKFGSVIYLKSIYTI